MTSEKERRQEAEWQILHDRITAVLDRYGRKDPFGRGDYWLIDDNWGWRDQQLAISDLELLRPHVIKALHGLLADFPEWRISMEVDGRRVARDWPQMGLIIYNDEIVDELQRDCLPEPYHSIAYIKASE